MHDAVVGHHPDTTQWQAQAGELATQEGRVRVDRLAQKRARLPIESSSALAIGSECRATLENRVGPRSAMPLASVMPSEDCRE